MVCTLEISKIISDDVGFIFVVTTHSNTWLLPRIVRPEAWPKVIMHNAKNGYGHLQGLVIKRHSIVAHTWVAFFSRLSAPRHVRRVLSHGEPGFLNALDGQHWWWSKLIDPPRDWLLTVALVQPEPLSTFFEDLSEFIPQGAMLQHPLDASYFLRIKKKHGPFRWIHGCCKAKPQFESQDHCRPRITARSANLFLTFGPQYSGSFGMIWFFWLGVGIASTLARSWFLLRKMAAAGLLRRTMVTAVLDDSMQEYKKMQSLNKAGCGMKQFARSHSRSDSQM